MTSASLAAWLAEPASRVAVIGASGWIGSAIVDRLLAALPSLAAPKLRLFGSAHRTIDIRGRSAPVEPLSQAAELGSGDWLVLHAAIIGTDRVEGGDPAKVRTVNDALLTRALALAERADVRRFVHFSSGAVHRRGFGGPAKQAYARMKADHEQMAADWAGRNSIGLLTPRVFNLGGPYINQVSAYALGDFIQAARRDGRIVIGAPDPVFRSYVHVCEMAEVVLDAALKPDAPSQPFDIAGAEVVELGALACAVGAALGMDELAVDRPPPSGGEDDWYVGDGRAYQTALFQAGAVPVPLERIIADTAAYLAGRS